MFQNVHQNEKKEAPQPCIETEKDHDESKPKGDQDPASSSKPVGKQGKQGSQGSDMPKEEYIHVRARRGQATNSHSLAERVMALQSSSVVLWYKWTESRGMLLIVSY